MDAASSASSRKTHGSRTVGYCLYFAIWVFCLTTSCRQFWAPPSVDEGPPLVNPSFYEPSTFIQSHTAAVHRESAEERRFVKEFNDPERSKKPCNYQAWIISSPTSKGIDVLVNVDENHEIFPAVGEICQIQLEAGPYKNRENSSPRFAERVESFHSLRGYKKKYAEFHVAPAASDHWIDENIGEQDEGKLLKSTRPPLETLLD